MQYENSGKTLQRPFEVKVGVPISSERYGNRHGMVISAIRYVAFDDGWVPWMIRMQIATTVKAYAPYVVLSYTPAVLSWALS